MDLTSQEYTHIERTKSQDIRYLMYDPTWRKAFRIYNKQADKPLKMGCRPCYYKVFNYFRLQRDE